MILQDVRPATELAPHHCGQTPRLVEARGRMRIDARLFGKPSRQYHVECTACGRATTPVYSRNTAEALWHIHAVRPLIPLADLPAHRLQAEQSLALAVAAA